MTELYLNPIVAWRAWLVFDYRIYSLRHIEWPYYAPLKAKCAVNINRNSSSRCISPHGIECTETIPPDQCWCLKLGYFRCGIYAYKKEASAIGECRSLLNNNVSGEVYLWGKITEGKYGYRAEFAYPKTLNMSPYTASRINPLILAEEYAVPVTVDSKYHGEEYVPQ